MTPGIRPSRPRDRQSQAHRLRKLRGRGIDERPRRAAEGLGREVSIDCGWGRLHFAQTFPDPEALVMRMRRERPGKRDIAFYLEEPHVVIAHAPQQLFLDPSYTYRLDLSVYRPARRRFRGFVIRRLATREDLAALDALYARLGMVPLGEDFFGRLREERALTILVAESEAEQAPRIVGGVMGVDHVRAFGDPAGGSSLWSLAVDPAAPFPGIGEALTRHLAEHMQARGRAFLDLSVMHDNEQAIALYEKLGFVRVPVFALKNRNSYNEPLFIGPEPDAGFNPYARIIIDEARRRGIAVEPIDPEYGYFRLSLGARSIVCRESLSELTSAIAMSRCADKHVTHRVLAAAGLRVPRQQLAGDPERDRTFLREVGRLVVKPRTGEQGAGVRVGIADEEALAEAIAEAREVDGEVILEEWVAGEDLRVVVINHEVVAAAIRRPARVVGDGRSTIRRLIEVQSRRRAAATDGESRIPLDEETKRMVAAAGFALDDVLPEGEVLAVRRTANLHTGGTLHDVTGDLHPALAEAAVAAARALDIPVVGVDMIVPDVHGPDHHIIEANERPGLANHEPQPTAERFIDLLFPETRAERSGGEEGKSA